jgi:chloride channel 3/4/5
MSHLDEDALDIQRSQSEPHIDSPKRYRQIYQNNIDTDQGDSDSDFDIKKNLERKPLLRVSTQTLRPSTFYSTSRSFTPTISVLGYTPLEESEQVILIDEFDGTAARDDHGIRWRYDNYTTIDWSFSLVQERKRLKQLQYLASKHVRTNQRWTLFEKMYHKYYYRVLKYVDSWEGWIVLTLVGICSAFIATVLDLTIPRLEEWRVGFCQDGWYKTRAACSSFAQWDQFLGGWSWIIWILSGTLFAIISTFVVEVSSSHDISAFIPTHQVSLGSTHIKRHYHAIGSGIPEVKTILGGFVIRGFLGVRTLFAKTFSLIFSISSGFVVGVQGPLVHICCAIGNVTTRLFSKYRSNDTKRREILSAACAGGVSVAFGAPMGGVLFSLEEVSMYFPPKTMWRSFYCALIGSVSLKLLTGVFL